MVPSARSSSARAGTAPAIHTAASVADIAIAVSRFRGSLLPIILIFALLGAWDNTMHACHSASPAERHRQDRNYRLREGPGHDGGRDSLDRRHLPPVAGSGRSAAPRSG